MAAAEKYVGARVQRKEDARFVTGTGSYVADLALPGMLHAVFLRSPYAHAKIKKVDVAAAQKLPGVVEVFTGEDLKDDIGSTPTAWVIPDSDLKTPPYQALATERVRYQGEAVAVVVAEDPAIGADAIELIDVDYEPLPVVVNQEEALKEGAPQLHEEAPGNQAFKWVLPGGDVDAAFEEADVVVEQRLVNQRLQPSAMEPRAALAQWDEVDEKLTLWVTSQNPHIHRLILAAFVLGIPENKLRVIAPDVGGGFGSKIPIYPWEAVVSHLARKLGRPVKWVESRTENYQATTHGRDMVQDVEMAAKKDGTILGIKIKAFANMGAYLSTAAPGIPTILFGFIISGAYTMKATHAEVIGVFTNTTPTDAYRGAGRPEAMFAVERMVDILARKLGMDPVEIRRKNFVSPDAFPYQIPTGLTYDSGNYPGTLAKALKILDYDAFREEQAKAREEGRLLGIGFSTYLELCGLAPSPVSTGTGFQGGLWGSSVCRMLPTGKVSVFTGAHPHGQGEETTFAQIAADELGVPVEDVEIVHGDTDMTPMGMGTYGSRTNPVEGGSVALSARKVVAKAKRIAAHLLEARTEDMAFEGGKFFVKGAPDKAKTIQEVAFAAYMAQSMPEGVEPILEATTFYDPTNFVYPFGAHICTVEVDSETGEVEILRYVAVDDCGTIINPMIVEGQVHGGVLQGVAQALWEEARYDEDGNLLTGSFTEYLVPTALESPKIETDHTVTPSPHNPLGAKGIGETGTIASSEAVINAIVDALEPYGVTHVDMPATPEKLWRLIQET
ncbi:MAG: xanthine dehydrogenase family protein molybdopterin-binding subunit [Thermoplasmata archaeon]